MAVTTYDLPPEQALRTTPDGYLQPMWPNLIELKRQDIPNLVVDNGSTYCVNVEAFRAARTFYGPRLRGHVMPRERSIDIDVPVDLELARYFARGDAR
jgi:N-acylneuraminate cytidylyltransferase